MAPEQVSQRGGCQYLQVNAGCVRPIDIHLSECFRYAQGVARVGSAFSSPSPLLRSNKATTCKTYGRSGRVLDSIERGCPNGWTWSPA